MPNASIREHAERIEPAQALRLCRDPKDDIFLSLAAAAKASYLVTADNDLLEDAQLRVTMLEQYEVQVLTVHDFLTLLSEAKADDDLA